MSSFLKRMLVKDIAFELVTGLKNLDFRIIAEEYKNNIAIDHTFVDTYCQPYEFDSLMHPQWNAFSVHPDYPTFIPKVILLCVGFIYLPSRECSHVDVSPGKTFP